LAEVFKKSFHVRWGDTDANAHMRNTAYLDMAADVRMMYFQDCGFSEPEFKGLRLGPIAMKDQLEYYREMKMLEPMDVTLELAGISEDGSRFHFRNTFYRRDGAMAAQVTSECGWLNLDLRRLAAPPEPLRMALIAISKTSDFKTLPSRVTG